LLQKHNKNVEKNVSYARCPIDAAIYGDAMQLQAALESVARDMPPSRLQI
jgi:hypothetical protein